MLLLNQVIVDADTNETLDIVIDAVNKLEGESCQVMLVLMKITIYSMIF